MAASDSEPLLVKGAVVRGYLELLRQDGVRDVILRRMPEASRMQIDPPPLFSTWIDAQPVQDLITALAAERGYESCRMLGVRATSGPLCNILVPIARAFLHYSALGPTTVFSNLERVAAIAVKLDSTGPAFYRQKRVGLYGEEFEIVKLRTMREDAEVDGQAQWAEKDDPRITRLGYWLRKLRIDELPQCWVVLKGEMSFVGPRPERMQFVKELEKDLRFYAERHMVKPGITGWAQVNYPYGASLEDARHKLEYDLYYAKNYTPFLDILILLQRMRVILWHDGAR